MTCFCDSILMRDHVRVAVVTRLASDGAPDCQYVAKLKNRRMGYTHSLSVSWTDVANSVALPCVDSEARIISGHSFYCCRFVYARPFYTEKRRRAWAYSHGFGEPLGAENRTVSDIRYLFWVEATNDRLAFINGRWAFPWLLAPSS